MLSQTIWPTAITAYPATMEEMVLSCRSEGLTELTNQDEKYWANGEVRVFILPTEDRVARIKKGDRPFEAFAQFCQESQENQYLPVIDDQFFLTDGTHVCVMERLEKIRVNDKYDETASDFEHFVNGYHMDPDKIHNFMQDQNLVDALRGMYMRLLDLNSENKRIPVNLDMHRGNLMLHKLSVPVNPKDFVFIDMFYEYSQNGVEFSISELCTEEKAALLNRFARFGVPIPDEIYEGEIPLFPDAPGNWPVQLLFDDLESAMHEQPIYKTKLIDPVYETDFSIIMSGEQLELSMERG